MLLLLFAKSWVNGYTRSGKFVAGYNRSSGAGAGQASFDFYSGKPLRSGTVNAQRDAGHAAANDLLGWSARRAGASLLRTRFPENFRDAGFASLIGRHVETSLDLAAVAQVCRDPRFETLRILFCDVRGNVVGQSAVTSRLPAVLQFATPKEFGPMLEHLDALASQYGASHYWLTHNHPNGSATPSKEDVQMTKAIAERIPMRRKARALGAGDSVLIFHGLFRVRIYRLSAASTDGSLFAAYRGAAGLDRGRRDADR